MRWALLVLPLLGMGPFEKNHPLVGDGEAAFERGDFEAALQKFDEADRELPNHAQIQFDRGTALHKLGRHDEARAAFLRAAELNVGKQPLESKIRYNLGNSWAATGNKKEAITEYRKALRKDPLDEQARHNLEVLLKDLPPPQANNTPDGGQGDGGHGDAGRHDAGTDGGKPHDGGRPVDAGQGDAGQGDGGSDGGSDGGPGGDAGQGDGGQGDGGRGDGGQGDAGSQGSERGDGGRGDAGEDQSDGGADEAEEPEVGDGGQMSAQEAKQWLDRLKSTERNPHQLWRFRPEQKDKKRRNEKDW